MEDTHGISAEDWSKGIILSIIASIIGGASKLAIRKSWLMEEGEDQSEEDDSINSSSSRHHLPLELNSSRNDSPRRTDGNRIGISLDDRIQERNRRRCIALLLRYSGMVGMSVINPIFCVLAMKYASPSILAPFSGLTLVWVILFSGLVVGETPSMAQRTASFLIIIGEVIVAVFGDHRNEVDMKPSEVLDSYKDPYLISFFVALALYMGLLAYWINFSKSPVLRRFAWGSCGGAITGPQNFLKDSMVLFHVSASLNWFILFSAFMAGASAFGGLLLLSNCMKRYDATYSAASFVGSFVVSASIMSAAHYKTFEKLKGVWNFVMYPFGLVVLMIGVLILVRESREFHSEVEIPVEGDLTVMRRDSEDSQDSQKPFRYTNVDEEAEGGGGGYQSLPLTLVI